MLSSISDKVRNTELRLATKKVGQKNAMMFLYVYGVLFFVLYIVGGYVFRHFFGMENRYHLFLYYIGMVIYPLAIYGARKAVAHYYKQTCQQLETHLKKLRDSQRNKLEELKKNTMYYKAKGLIDRYDPDSQSGSSQTDLGSGSKVIKKIMDLPSYSNASRRTLFDRVADLILGEEQLYKYALICQNCHAHNGLADPEKFETIEYFCPKCKFHNKGKKPGADIGTLELEPHPDSKSLRSESSRSRHSKSKPQHELFADKKPALKLKRTASNEYPRKRDAPECNSNKF